jgi:hypothetical protein
MRAGEVLVPSESKAPRSKSKIYDIKPPSPSSADESSPSNLVAKSRISMRKTKSFVLPDSTTSSSADEASPPQTAYNDHRPQPRVSVSRDKRSLATPFGATFSGRSSTKHRACGEGSPEIQESTERLFLDSTDQDSSFAIQKEGKSSGSVAFDSTTSTPADTTPPTTLSQPSRPLSASPSSPLRRLQNALSWSDDLLAHPLGSGPSPPATQQPRIALAAIRVPGASAAAEQPASSALVSAGRIAALRLWRSESPVRRLRGGPGLFAPPPPPPPPPPLDTAAGPSEDDDSGPAQESPGQDEQESWARYVRGVPHGKSSGRRQRPSSPIAPSLSPPARRAPYRPSPPAGSDSDFTAAAAQSPKARLARVRPCSPLAPSRARRGGWAVPAGRHFDSDAEASPELELEGGGPTRRPSRPVQVLLPLAARTCSQGESQLPNPAVRGRGPGGPRRNGLTPLLLRAGGPAVVGGMGAIQARPEAMSR